VIALSLSRLRDHWLSLARTGGKENEREIERERESERASKRASERASDRERERERETASERASEREPVITQARERAPLSLSLSLSLTCSLARPRSLSLSLPTRIRDPVGTFLFYVYCVIYYVNARSEHLLHKRCSTKNLQKTLWRKKTHTLSLSLYQSLSVTISHYNLVLARGAGTNGLVQQTTTNIYNLVHLLCKRT